MGTRARGPLTTGHVRTRPPLPVRTRRRTRARDRAGVAGGRVPDRHLAAAGAAAEAAAHARVRHDLPQPGRPARGAGQERRPHRRPAVAGLRFRTGPHGHTPTPGGPPHAPPVPAAPPPANPPTPRAPPPP